MASRKPKTNPKQAVAVKEQSSWGTLALGLALVAATFTAHFPAIHAGYIWDDSMFLYGSPLVTATDGLYKAWFTAEGSDYWPLMSTMFWIEWRIWGKEPMPYHATNIALHAAAVVLLWQLLKRLKVGDTGAYLAGLLFAVHPATVESVAWISERKNVLSMSFFLLAILAYLRFEDRNSRRWYALALVAAAAALLAKVSAVMLPVVLLLCIWWRHSHVTRKNLLRTVPFFVMSLVLGLVEMWFVRNQVLQGELGRPEGFASRIAASGWVVWFYLYKIVWPINLAIVYPRWHIDGGRAMSYGPLALLVASFIVLWVFRRSWSRAPLAAMGYFVVMLLPVAGLLNMQFNRYSLVADHLQYPAMPAIMALLGCSLAAGWSWLQHRGSSLLSRSCVVVVATIVLTLGILTWRQARVYHDEISLWSHTIAINNRAWVAYNNRGAAYSEKGWQTPAIKDFDKAIELMPKYPEAYNNRGCAYHKIDNFAQAIRDCSQAIKLKPDFANAYNSRGIAYAKSGQQDAGIKDFNKSIELLPTNPDPYNNRAVTLHALKECDKAWADVKMYRKLGGTPHPAFVRELSKASERRE